MHLIVVALLRVLREGKKGVDTNLNVVLLATRNYGMDAVMVLTNKSVLILNKIMINKLLFVYKR
jgi:hypothetical protein